MRAANGLDTLLLLQAGDRRENSREIPPWAGVSTGLHLAGRAARTRRSLPPEPWGMPNLGGHTDLKLSRYAWVHHGGESPWVSDQRDQRHRSEGSPAW